MDFNTVYAQKLTTADRVAALVKDDDWVDYGWAIGTPVSFDAALAKRLPELHGIKFRGGILCHVPEIFKIENQAEHFCWNSWHMGGIERKAVAAGYAYYSPLRYSELPRYYRESPDPLNIAVFVVAPMDSHGYFNLGPCASHLADAARKADKVFVEVNKNMPVCLGGYDNCLHISQVDGIIEGDNPPIDQLGGGHLPTGNGPGAGGSPAAQGTGQYGERPQPGIWCADLFFSGADLRHAAGPRQADADGTGADERLDGSYRGERHV